MQFLKILFWCLIAFMAAVFTLGNWTWVEIKLWGGLVATTNLPFLLLMAFLAGLVPTMIYQHWVRWRMTQRLESLERQLATLRALAAAPASPRPIQAHAPAISTLPADSSPAPLPPEPPVAADTESATFRDAPPP